MTIKRYLIITLLALTLCGCVQQKAGVPITPDNIYYYISTYAYGGDGFYDVETGVELEKDDRRRVEMSSKCSLMAQEDSWNCYWVKDPDHPTAKKLGCSEAMPHRCNLQFTTDRSGELVPFFPELERQCALELGVIRKNPQYDSAYANAESEYLANPRFGNTKKCIDG